MSWLNVFDILGSLHGNMKWSIALHIFEIQRRVPVEDVAEGVVGVANVVVVVFFVPDSVVKRRLTQQILRSQRHVAFFVEKVKGFRLIIHCSIMEAGLTSYTFELIVCLRFH